MASSMSFRVPEVVSPELQDIIEIKCELLKKTREEDRRNKILKQLKEEKSALQNTLDIKKKEFNNTKKFLEQISNQRKIYDLEKEIEHTLNSQCLTSETGESLEHHPKDLINSIKTMRNKIDICNLLINSDELDELTLETIKKLKEFQENFTYEMNLAKDFNLFNENLSESYDSQQKCAKLVGLVERLTTHAHALASTKNNITKD
ncbi:unnamed protein product [Nezara viridula]|uniref:Uncharacterized protein n=1 Tax=Nezara viridula TaxID=85310 RepID=A0A9P0E703_NEZVI|nr:unnamed protein product [Nezara viridula]